LSTDELIDLIKGSSAPEMPSKELGQGSTVKRRGRPKKAT
jgi:hypothetical protein